MPKKSKQYCSKKFIGCGTNECNFRSVLFRKKNTKSYSLLGKAHGGTYGINQRNTHNFVSNTLYFMNEHWKTYYR